LPVSERNAERAAASVARANEESTIEA